MSLLSSRGVTPPAPAFSAAAKDAPQAPRNFRRAAVLTYRTAPHPNDSIEGIFEALLMLAADQLDPNGEARESSRSSASRAEKRGWLGRAWRHVVNYASSDLWQMHQADFLKAFSRQLELNPAEESSTVMVSCQCFMVSGGKLHFGSLFATNCGLYFCSCTPETALAAATAAEYDASSNTTADSGDAEDEIEYIKERILFTDVASLLPSISLEQHGTVTPFIQGIPSGVVAPTALQVFTVQLSTVLQFVDLHKVAVKQPKKFAAEAKRFSDDTVQDAPCTDVVQKCEYNLVCKLPPNLETLKFCALLWRLWTQRLHELGRPLENPAAHYAEPH
ncbi:hypothetical protein MNV84_03402 [Leishmania braziliensis]|nr:hypothetical protein MNV84_03402 [Leishmania braziliensis]